MGEKHSTTSLLEIRDFLNTHHAAPTPWESPKNSVNRLYELLCTRKDDELFWLDLKDLLSRLEDRRFNVIALQGSQTLSGTTVDKLIDDLRLSLGELKQDGNGTAMKFWISRSAGIAALCAFLLLGLATGFTNKGTVNEQHIIEFEDRSYPVELEQDDPSVNIDDLYFKEYEGQSLTYDEAVVLDLVDIIHTVPVPSSTMEDLLECLPDLDAAYRESLLDLFQNLTDEELASHLEEMNQPTGVCGTNYETLSADDDMDHSNQAEDDLPDGNSMSSPVRDFETCCGCRDYGDDDDDDDDH